MLNQAVPRGVIALMVQANSDDPARLTDHLSRVHDACGLPVVVQDCEVGVPLFGGLGGVGLLDEFVATVTGRHDGGFPAARDAIALWLPLINFEGQVQIGLAVRKEHFRMRGVLTSSAPGRCRRDLLGHVDRHLSAVDRL